MQKTKKKIITKNRQDPFICASEWKKISGASKCKQVMI